jgi:hypothetical protein
MMHLNEGQLRAHIDGELGPAEARHLSECAECRARLTALAGQHTRVAGRMTALVPAQSAPAAQAALLKFQSKYKSEIEKEKQLMSKKLWPRLRPVLAGALALAVVVAAFTFAPVQQAFSAFLGLFRVQQVAVLPIDLGNFDRSANGEAVGEQMAQLFSDSMTVTNEADEPQTVATAEEASQLAGFTVRTLAGREASTFTVSGASAFEFTINRAQGQAVLDELGHSDLQLPASLDGAVVSANIPAGVMTLYGDCEQGIRACVEFIQIPSPEVNTPADVNLAQLAEIGLQVTGMSAEEARAFSQKIDWATTLVIPVPTDAATYKEVSVDGVTGQFIAYAENGHVATRYIVMWAKDGMVYGLSGFGTEAEALALANSIQ